MSQIQSAFVNFGDSKYNWDPQHVCQSNEEAIDTIWAFAVGREDGCELEALVRRQDSEVPHGVSRYRILSTVAKDFLGVVSPAGDNCITLIDAHIGPFHTFSC